MEGQTAIVKPWKVGISEGEGYAGTYFLGDLTYQLG